MTEKEKENKKKKRERSDLGGSPAAGFGELPTRSGRDDQPSSGGGRRRRTRSRVGEPPRRIGIVYSPRGGDAEELQLHPQSHLHFPPGSCHLPLCGSDWDANKGFPRNERGKVRERKNQQRIYSRGVGDGRLVPDFASRGREIAYESPKGMVKVRTPTAFRAERYMVLFLFAAPPPFQISELAEAETKPSRERERWRCK